MLDGDIESVSWHLAIALPYELYDPVCLSFRTSPCLSLSLEDFPQHAFSLT